MPKYFGTDGFRGRAGVTLTARHAYHIGQFLAHHLRQDRPAGADGARVRAVIGKDTRRSCYMLEYAMAAGLTAAGADAYMLHVVTTPGVSHAVTTDGFDVGIMISASHNPYDDNGIKLINRRGEKMEDATLEQIEAYLDGIAAGQVAPVPQAEGDAIGQIVDHAAGRNRYIAYLISLAAFSYRGLHIALDCANGSAWMIARHVFESLGATVHAIGISPDGLNINRGVGSTHIGHLRDYVKSHRVDLGFAFDGDADRCIAVDERGEVIDGDRILYVLACDMARRGILTGNTVVTTVMSNMGLYRALDAAGIAHVQTAVGDRFIYERMRQDGYALGGEQSGHMIVRKYATTGDGILTAILLTETVLASKLPLGKLAAPVHLFPQITRNLPVRDKDAVMTDGAVLRKLAELTEELGDRGRILLRKSGTEPMVRVMAEATSEEECRRYADALAEVIEMREGTR
ncbi:MAG: phosphoglucosamine mutase [Clostridia bacterium]|nr:phosphoglucosamine mutase [Clostridia bacterium]